MPTSTRSVTHLASGGALLECSPSCPNAVRAQINVATADTQTIARKFAVMFPSFLELVGIVPTTITARRACVALPLHELGYTDRDSPGLHEMRCFMMSLRHYAAGAAIGFMVMLSGCADRPNTVPASATLM